MGFHAPTVLFLIAQLLVSISSNDTNHQIRKHATVERRIGIGRGPPRTPTSTVDLSEERSAKCLLVKAGALKPNGEEDTTWCCVFEEKGNTIFDIEGLPNVFYRQNFANLTSGTTEMVITAPKLGSGIAPAPKPYVLKIPRGSHIELKQRPPGKDNKQRRLIKTVGISSVLVVRVVDENGDAPEKTMKQLSDDIFGTSGDKYNLRSQYAACSGGKLDFLPAKGKNIWNGVTEVTVPHTVAGKSFFRVQNWVSEVAPDVVGDLSRWTHVMYIFPSSVDDTYIGYAYYNWYLSLYFDVQASNLLVTMHEIGHNINNYHSGEQDDPYGDGTCMMGSHVYEDDKPLMCFNGAKSWWFGWYEDRHIEIDPTKGPWRGKLVGVDDYVNDRIRSSEQYVIVRVKEISLDDLFLMYNRKVGINAQVYEKGDTVTVVQQKGKIATSWLLAGVTEETQPYRYSRWNGGLFDLVIQVCRRVPGVPEYAEVLVFLDNGRDNLVCGRKKPRPSVIVPKAVPDLPTIVELNGASGSDFYQEKRGGKVTRGAATHELFSRDQMKQAFRFRATKKNSIPRRAVIVSAMMLVYPAEESVKSNAPIIGYAVGDANGDSTGYRSGVQYQITNAPKTAANVTIGKNLKQWKKPAYQKLVDVGPIVEEIVARNDYKKGNSIKIFLIGTDTSSSRVIQTSVSNDTTQPLLRVKYSLIPIAVAGEDYAATRGKPFTVDGSKSRGPIAKYIWDFGDGVTLTSTDPTATHTYDTAGSFEIKLTVENIGGEQRQDRKTATVAENMPPTAVLTCPPSGNTSTDFSFDGSKSSDPEDGSVSAFFWKFGDGNEVRSDSMISHKYDKPGEYKVSLKVRDSSKDKDVATCIVSVAPAVVTKAAVIEIERQITKKKDDYIQSSTGNINYELETHRLWTPSHELHAYRFRDIAVPPRAIILEARLEMMAKGSWPAHKVIIGTVWGEAAGFSRKFQPGNMLTDTKLTRASVKIRDLPAWKTNTYYALADVAPVLQEIVNRDDYEKGNAIKLILSGDGSPDPRKVRTSISEAGAKLIIRYQ